MDLILASESPRRTELLRKAGFTFTVRARPVEEVRNPREAPADYCRRLARKKADAAWENNPNEVVLGADTIVVLDGRVMEKPADEVDARGMISALSGRWHLVLTGICLLHRGGHVMDYDSTLVHFVGMSGSEIENYVASGESMDKAGGYAIQGKASKFIDRIEGCYFNVMGLPVARVYRAWKSIVSL
jgi:septum formation protein